MAINYTKVTWVNGAPPALSAENINHMDDGIKAATRANSSLYSRIERYNKTKRIPQ